MFNNTIKNSLFYPEICKKIREEPYHGINYSILADWYYEHDMLDHGKFCNNLAKIMYNEKEIEHQFYDYERQFHKRLKMPCDIHGTYFLGIRLGAMYYGSEYDDTRESYQDLHVFTAKDEDIMILKKDNLEPITGGGFYSAEWVHKEIILGYPYAVAPLRIKYNLVRNYMLLDPFWSNGWVNQIRNREIK